MDQRLAALDSDKAVVATNIGDTASILNASGKVIEAQYHTPYLVHATMEPVVATAHVRDGEVEVWGPIQGQDMVRKTLGKYFSIAPDKVIVHTTFLGRSFGRKYVPDLSSTPRSLQKRSAVPSRSSAPERKISVTAIIAPARPRDSGRCLRPTDIRRRCTPASSVDRFTP